MSTSSVIRFIVTGLLSVNSVLSFCQTQLSDTLILDTVIVEVKGMVRSLHVKSGDIKLDRELLESLPQFAGESDFFRQLQLFPNVSSANEYDTGIYVHGGEASHNQVLVAGAPIYQVGHLLGLFSAFSSTHFTTARLSSVSSRCNYGNWLGATLEIEPKNQAQSKFGGKLSVSPLAAQGTLICPIASSSSVTISARATFLDLLYQQWLKNDGDQIKYNFYDLNASFVSNRKNDTYKFDFYYSSDNCGLASTSSIYDLTTDWENLAISGRWVREWRSDFCIKQTVFYSSFTNRLHFRYANAEISSPSGISSWGYNADIHSLLFDCGIMYRGHLLAPQSPINVLSSRRTALHQTGHELSAYFNKEVSYGKCHLLLSMNFNLFHNMSGYTIFPANPSARVSYFVSEALTLRADAHIRHQHLFRAGLSSIGLPIEFWFASDKTFHSQRAIGTDLGVDWLICRGDYGLSVELFYESLTKQCEYIGDLLGLWDKDYQWQNHIIQGRGKNYGIGLIIQKRKGPLAGWFSYSFNRSLRQFDTQMLSGSFPSSHDRPHELNALLSYHFASKWSFSSSYVLASGTPFTAPSSFYIINGNIVSQFGDFNSRRLPAYKRLDLSANYEVRKKTFCYIINCTLYNALFFHNSIFYRLKYYDGEYAYCRLGFFARMLPSISISIKF